MDTYFLPRNVIRLMLKVVVSPDGCWLWQGVTTKDGYGLISVQSQNRTVHRYVKELLRGKRLPKGLEASHLCKNKHCCNPDHVVVETHKENMARSPMVSVHRKLTWDQVLEIRSSPLSYSQLAVKLGINRWSLWRIKKGIHYKIPTRAERLSLALTT